MRIRKSDKKFPASDCPKCHATLYSVEPYEEGPVFVSINGHEFLAQEFSCEECGVYWVHYYKYHSTHFDLIDDQ